MKANRPRLSGFNARDLFPLTTLLWLLLTDLPDLDLDRVDRDTEVPDCGDRDENHVRHN